MKAHQYSGYRQLTKDAKGEDAGIHLTATTKNGKSHQKVVALPAEGKSLNCMTCHNGKVHILMPEKKD